MICETLRWEVWRHGETLGDIYLFTNHDIVKKNKNQINMIINYEENMKEKEGIDGEKLITMNI